MYSGQRSHLFENGLRSIQRRTQDYNVRVQLKNDLLVGVLEKHCCSVLLLTELRSEA